MVIEKVLKVNSNDPKVEELRRKLAAMQQAAQTSASPAPAPVAATQASMPAQQAMPTRPPDEVAKLTALSVEEQKRLAERQNPELRAREDRTMNLIASQIRELISLSTESNKRVKELELKQLDLQKQLDLFRDKHEETLQKMASIDSRLEKFMGLYELITNQYNPFADNSKVLSKIASPAAAVPPVAAASAFAPVKPVAGTFAVQDSITRQTNTVEVKPEDAQSAAANFKKVEEMLAALHKQVHGAPAPTESSPPVPQGAHEGMHSLLAGFEERLKRQFDASLQTQLHERFASLEQHLEDELRDALRHELQQLQAEDEAVQKTLADLQALTQNKETSHRPAVEEEIAELSREVSRVRDEFKAIPPSLYFRLADGQILRDLHELAAAVARMDERVFSAHVSATRNDFADWTEQALRLPDHALAIRHVRTLPELKKLFADAR